MSDTGPHRRRILCGPLYAKLIVEAERLRRYPAIADRPCEARPRAGKTDANGHAKANARSKHAPSHVANFSGTSNHVIP